MTVMSLKRLLICIDRCYRINGFYNGIKMLVPPSESISDQEYIRLNTTAMDRYGDDDSHFTLPDSPPLDPVVMNPYPDYKSSEYLKNYDPIQDCYMDEDETVPVPDVYAYPGTPQGMTDPAFGNHEELGLSPGMCFDRVGRFGPYGYGYDINEGGSGVGLGKSLEHSGAEKVWKMAERRLGKKIDYRTVNWGKAQGRCLEKNKARFNTSMSSEKGSKFTAGKRKVPRTAFILRTWVGYNYTPHEILTLRALINELSLKSGGEYTVHLLVHVKDNNIPIYSSSKVYRETVEANVPEEFWDIATLWSESMLSVYYPGPFLYNVDNHSQKPIHDVYRSAHFALQWFANEKFPDYDFYWNWEMDLRLTGHYYQFFQGLMDWGRKQPRKGIWERSSRYWIPEFHGDYSTTFRQKVETETAENEAEEPVWGPIGLKLKDGSIENPKDTTPPRSYSEDRYEWGVGEYPDLITLNPIFDPAKTNWVFGRDVTGYDIDTNGTDSGNKEAEHLPPRRTAIITASLLSRRLLSLMHRGTAEHHHTMFPEMYAPSVALHHGLKAVFAPHPVYFDRIWPLEHLDQVANHPKHRHESIFGWGEHNLQGSSFYYNSRFAGALWRRFFGARENNEGGPGEEGEKRDVPGERGQGSGRMCLRNIVLHPVKRDS